MILPSYTRLYFEKLRAGEKIRNYTPVFLIEIQIIPTIPEAKSQIATGSGTAETVSTSEIAYIGRLSLFGSF